MASHNSEAPNEEIQTKIQAQSLDRPAATNEQQIQASLAIRTFISKDLDRPDTKHAAFLQFCGHRRATIASNHDGAREWKTAFGASFLRRR